MGVGSVMDQMLRPASVRAPVPVTLTETHCRLNMSQFCNMVPVSVLEKQNLENPEINPPPVESSF